MKIFNLFIFYLFSHGIAFYLPNVDNNIKNVSFKLNNNNTIIINDKQNIITNYNNEYLLICGLIINSILFIINILLFYYNIIYKKKQCSQSIQTNIEEIDNNKIISLTKYINNRDLENLNLEDIELENVIESTKFIKKDNKENYNTFYDIINKHIPFEIYENPMLLNKKNNKIEPLYTQSVDSYIFSEEKEKYFEENKSFEENESLKKNESFSEKIQSFSEKTGFYLHKIFRKI